MEPTIRTAETMKRISDTISLASRMQSIMGSINEAAQYGYYGVHYPPHFFTDEVITELRSRGFGVREHMTASLWEWVITW